MAVSTTYTPTTYNGNSSTTVFAVAWPFFTGTLLVTAISSTGVETVKSLGTHYTVTGGTDANGLPATGSVTMLAAPATGTTLRIERTTPKVQSTIWVENDPFPAKSVEAMADRLMLIAQENSGSSGGVVTGDALRLDTSGATDYYNASTYPIRSTATPTVDSDLVTKVYGDANYGGAAATNAAASAAAASASETAAETAETNAETAETNAEVAQTAAAASAVAAAASAVSAAASADEAEAIVNGTVPAYTMKANITGATAASANATVSEVKTLLNYTKSDVGLDDVTNTADADKPVSSAQQTALDAKVATTRAVNTSTGLTGGGALSADRTIALDVNALTEDTSPDTAADFLLSYDTSASAHKKVKPSRVEAVKAWVTINRSDGAIKSSSGVASVARDSAAVYTVTFTTAMADTNYSVQVTTDGVARLGSYSDKGTSAVKIRVTLPSDGLAYDSNFTEASVAIFR